MAQEDQKISIRQDVIAMGRLETSNWQDINAVGKWRLLKILIWTQIV